ncbi:MAG: hypothetical protein WEB59_07655 [Thermoanaerobaculia bacterium]
MKQKPLSKTEAARRAEEERRAEKRRAEKRRAHDRFVPGKTDRNDRRREGERRRKT